MQKSYSNYLKVSEPQQIVLTELLLSIKNRPEMLLQMCCFHQNFYFTVIDFYIGQKLCRQPHLCTSPSLVPFLPTTRLPISPIYLHPQLLTKGDPLHKEPSALGQLLNKGRGRENKLKRDSFGVQSMKLGQAIWRELSTGEAGIRWARMIEAEGSKDFATDCPVMKLKYRALNCKVGEAEWDKRKARE